MLTGRGGGGKGNHTGHSQGDDPGREALGDGLGVHAEGAVFGAGAGGRTAGGLRGSPGVRRPRQAEGQSRQADERRPLPACERLQHRVSRRRREGMSLFQCVLSGASSCGGQAATTALLKREREDREGGWSSSLGGVEALQSSSPSL